MAVQSLSPLAIKRIYKDLKELNEEIEKKKLVGVNALPYNDNLNEIHANIIPSDGPYKGMIMHVILIIPATYPQGSPSGRMAQGFPFDHNHHEHIHSRTQGNVICADYLSDFQQYFQMMDGGQIKAGYGWTPAMTLSKLLVSLQQFFAQTDLRIPSETEIKKTKQNIDAYSCKCGHKTIQPFPSLVSEQEFNETVNSVINKISNNMKNVSIDETKKKSNDIKKRQMDQIKELLTCSFTRENPIDNKTVILGYPILTNLDSRNRIHSTLIPEPFSYDFFASEIQRNDFKLDRYSSTTFRSASGKPYNQFLPIFINEEHFERARQHIENSISILSSNTASGENKYDFDQMMIPRVLLNLMNQMVVMMMDCSVHESESIIMAYCHLMRLFVKFTEIYPKLVKYIRDKTANFLNNNEDRSKTHVPDLGEFIVALGINAILPKNKYESICTFDDPKMKKVLLDEFFARQIFWIEKDNPTIYGVAQNERLRLSFNQTLVSNKLLVFNLMFSKFFLFEGVTNNLDSQYGLPPVHIIESFQQMIKKIKNINSYPEFLQAINYFNVLDTPDKLISQLNRAKSISEQRGYTGEIAKERKERIEANRNNSQSSSSNY